jgi:hypothetical protein
MATNNRGGNRSSGGNRSNENSSKRSGEANRSQSSGGGFLASVKARPFASAAIAAGAAGASAFLWAKRAQLSDRVSDLSDAVTERFSSDDDQSSGSGASGDLGSQRMTGAGTSSATATTGRKGRGSRAPAVDPVIDDEIEAGSVAYGA